MAMHTLAYLLIQIKSKVRVECKVNLDLLSGFFFSKVPLSYYPVLDLVFLTASGEGAVNYNAVLFIPAQAPYDFYTKEFKKGLSLYSSGVMIMEKCADLLPDYFSFVKGLVDSSDLSLNISREMLQHDRQLKIIARALEKKIKNELLKMQENDREKYEKFFTEFGNQIKFGIYESYGANAENLKDLIMFVSSKEKNRKIDLSSIK